jgi:hypothetical protein
MFNDDHIGIGLEADILQLRRVFTSIAVPGSHDPTGLLPGAALPSIGKLGGYFLLRHRCILVRLANFMRDQPIDIGLHDPLVFSGQFIQPFQLAWIGLVKFEMGDRFLHDCSAP